MRLFGWSLLLFAAGIVLTAIAGIWGAADLIGNSPFTSSADSVTIPGGD